MYLSLNWLKKYVDLEGLSPEMIMDRLTLHTAEIEGIEERGAHLDKILVARITSIEPLVETARLLQIDAGKACEVVCGDMTLEVGQWVAYAPPGSTIKGEAVTAKNLHGKESAGFLASEAELEISDHAAQVFRLEHPAPKAGMTLLEAFPFLKDHLLELDNKSVTHRADLWGIYGFCRELSAIFERELKPLPVLSLQEINASSIPGPSISVENGEKCPRYAGMTIQGLKDRPSSLEMRTLLFYSELKPISLLVDLTNFVMAELGQPMHAFDNRFAKGGIQVADWGKADAEYVLLDGSSRKLPADALMICNKDREPIALAGVMGGEQSKITSDVSELLLESANFDAKTIRVTANGIKLRTDASNRFEKSLVPQNAVFAIQRFMKLVQELYPDATWSQMNEVNFTDDTLSQIDLKADFVRTFSGVDFSDAEISGILSRLGFKNVLAAGVFKVTVPWFRSKKDISMKQDLVEEISRVFGYDNIVPKAPLLPIEPLHPNLLLETEYLLKEKLSFTYGFNEVRTYGWDDTRWLEALGISFPNAIKLINPRSVFTESMKESLVPALLQHAQQNATSYRDFNIYEFESVWKGMGETHEEKKSLAGVLFNKAGKETDMIFKIKDFFSQLFKAEKNRVLEFREGLEGQNVPWSDEGMSLSLFCEGQCYGYIGALDRRMRKVEFSNANVVTFAFDAELFSQLEAKILTFQVPNPYPLVSLDFNIVASQDKSFTDVKAVIDSFRSDLMMGAEFKEFYQDKKSMAGFNSYLFTLTAGSPDRTLSSDEITTFQESFIGLLKENEMTLK